ncbi:MAG: hypothetical protein PHO46_06800 [Thermoguttaceae bacterium]|jgi:hypothetical protein|nr:hypothetical protein [Thermoguttaceae bacterium]
MKKYIAAALVVALVCAVSTGCGSNKKKEVEISGAATIDGVPIDHGLVQFFNEATEGGGVIQDGQYTGRVPTGELTVRVRGYQYTGPMPEVPEPSPNAPPSAPPERPRKPITSEDLWLNPTFKITIDKGGTYDLNFTSSE